MNFFKSLWSSSSKTEDKPTDILTEREVENPDEVANDPKEEDAQSKEQRSSLWQSLSNKLGTDVIVGVTLPVWMNEPTSVLQRQCEMIHFHELLTEAASFESSLDRLAWVAIFAITAYNGTERYGKPFNPILGETFEYEDKRLGVKFLSEQVSHHPPISAAHCEGRDFVFWQDTRPKSRFLGNSFELDTQGKTHIYFPKTRDHYVYTTTPTSRINNLIIGRMWIDHYGTLTVNNIKNGENCTLTFEKCGWLGKGRHEVTGCVKDSNDKTCLYISGKWSESMSVKWLYDNGRESRDTSVVVWRRPPNNAIGKYKLTEFAASLLDLDDQYVPVLPVSDSRLRPDRRALERGDMTEAGQAKHRLEEKQRAEKKIRKNEEWSPRWFKQIPEENGQALIWVYCGDYWDQRQEKVEVIEKLKVLPVTEAKTLKEEMERERDALLNKGIRGSSCDFTSVN